MGAKAFTLWRKYHYDRNADELSLMQTMEDEQDGDPQCLGPRTVSSCPTNRGNQSTRSYSVRQALHSLGRGRFVARKGVASAVNADMTTVCVAIRSRTSSAINASAELQGPLATLAMSRQDAENLPRFVGAIKDAPTRNSAKGQTPAHDVSLAWEARGDLPPEIRTIDYLRMAPWWVDS